MSLTRILCLTASPRFSAIGRTYGWRYGTQLPCTVYPDFDLYFADQDWKRPCRDTYMDALARYRPTMATVLDLEHREQYSDVLDWAAQAAAWVQQVVIIPKITGIIPMIPDRIGSAHIILGYSVPTRYGGTTVPIWEFADRPVHLLGGSPHVQMAYWCVFTGHPAPAWMSERLRTFVAKHQMFGRSVVVSVDGNMAARMANTHAAFWRQDRGAKGHWVQLQEIQEGHLTDAPYRAMAYSMRNSAHAWHLLHDQAQKDQKDQED